MNAWARELRQAGVEGSMDELRARSYLDLLLDRDSRPAHGNPPSPDGTTSTGPDGDTGAGHTGGDGPGGPGRAGPDGSSPAGGPGRGLIPAGFAGKINLTVPATTLLDLAGRPGEITGIGPVDPGLARDLASAAAANPKTTWCVTVTDTDGHAVGHGCARPEPKNKRIKHSQPGGPGPPGGTGGPRFTFTPDRRDGPPGGYGIWRLSIGIPGRPDLIISLGPITTNPCDHRHEARGHDPGVLLRHLTQIRNAT